MAGGPATACAFLSLAGTRRGCLLFHDPAECFRGDETERQQVIAPKGIRGLPFLAIPVITPEGGIEPRSLRAVILPDGGLKSGKTDFMRGFLIWCVL